MKTLKNIQVKVTYVVGLGGDEVSDEVIHQLEKIHNGSEIVDGLDNKFPEATEWMNAYIQEKDAFDLEYEIEELEKL